MKDLTIYESIILLAILKLKNKAYGVLIREEAAKAMGRAVSYGTLYSYLDQLYRKGFVNKFTGEPTSERGGRRKIYYSLTPLGKEALESAYSMHKSVWADAQALLKKT